MLGSLQKLLLGDERLMVEGELNKNKAAELARRYDVELLNRLQTDEAVKRHFFVPTDGGLIFRLEVFLQFLADKSFLPDSFTAYKNKVGLAIAPDTLLAEGHDVVLNWPYKDCVLEGGQDKDDIKREEVFFNQTLAPDQINRLLDDKVFSGWQRHDDSGARPLDGLRDDDNLILKGNNLVVLHSLTRRFAGRVKLIYIDPPFNTGSDSFGYNDHFKHSTWLTFMKNRLEAARELLSHDGSIYVHLDYNEVHYAKVLMDEIFGADCFQREIIWRIGWISGHKSAARNWIRNHDSILFYSKSPKGFAFNKEYIPYPEGYTRRDGSLPEGKGYPIEDTWNANELDSLNSIAIMSFSREKVGNFKGQKNENLLTRIIRSATDPGDIVLDYHLGTGTTAAVAHKLGRQYIGIEQMYYGDKDPEVRLQKVVAGEQTGISKETGWHGGGSFVTATIRNDANDFRQRVQQAGSDQSLQELLDEARKSSFLSYRVDPARLNPKGKDFKDLSQAHKQQLLLELVDNNTLYVNYTDIDDANYALSAEDKRHNHSFYGRLDRTEQSEGQGRGRRGASNDAA